MDQLLSAKKEDSIFFFSQKSSPTCYPNTCFRSSFIKERPPAQGIRPRLGIQLQPSTSGYGLLASLLESYVQLFLHCMLSSSWSEVQWTQKFSANIPSNIQWWYKDKITTITFPTATGFQSKLMAIQLSKVFQTPDLVKSAACVHLFSSQTLLDLLFFFIILFHTSPTLYLFPSFPVSEPCLLIPSLWLLESTYTRSLPWTFGSGVTVHSCC